MTRPTSTQGAGKRLLAGPAVLVLAAVVTAGLLGCATTASVEPLEVTLADLEIAEVTVFETTLLARLRVTNPNPDPVAIDGASFKLLLDGTKVGTGTAPAAFAVERLGSTVIDAEFHINNATALLRVKDMLDKQTVSYGVTGSLFSRGPFGTRRIRVEKSGSLDLGEGIPAQGAGP
jgi:LEA14-like dessication related protein